MRKTIFISDLHLQESEQHTLQIFLKLLDHAQTADSLYILGDLFEVWVGDDDLSPFNLQVIQALKQATNNGLPIYFIPGNRDFLIGKKFAIKTGIKILKDPTTIDLYGISTLLMHGDSLCTLDIKHQKIRTYTQNRFYQWLALQLPLSWRKKMGLWLRGKSRKHIHASQLYIMDVEPKTVEEVMKKNQVTQLIHGHTHRPNVHTHPGGLRYVLGAWHHTGNMLVCNATGSCDLQTYDL